MPKNSPSSPGANTAAGPGGAGGGAGGPAGPGGGTSAGTCGNSTAAGCPCAGASITSQTVATVPSNRARTRLGVGESTVLTYSLGSATWTQSPGNAGGLSGTSGSSVTYTAPDRANTVTITATGGGCTATITLTIVEPSDVRMVRAPGTQGHHTHNTASTGFIADIFIMPADVSFENITVTEDEVNAVGTGCYQAYLAAHPMGHHPNASPIPVGPPTSDTSGSKVTGQDRIWGQGSKCDGGWTWSIPWRFDVSGSPKLIRNIDEVFSSTAAGAADISKGGASNHSEFGDATEIDPLF